MKRFLLCVFLPCLSFGVDSYLLGLGEILKTQSQTNLNLIRSLFESNQEQIYLSPSFSYSKESLYKSYKGEFSLFSKIDDEGTLIPFLHYTYTHLQHTQETLQSHSISAGLKAKIDSDFLEVFSGFSIGGNFGEFKNRYSLLFVDAQLGVGKEFDFLENRFKISPLLFLDYSYLYQKPISHIDRQSHHSLSMLLGTEFDLGLSGGKNYRLSLSLFGFYRHLFLGEELTNSNAQYSLQRDSGYAGLGLNWEYQKLLFSLHFNTEFTKTTYTLQTLARIGVEF